MGSFFGSILSWLISRFFGKAPPRSQEAVQSERAAVAETKLSTISDTASVEAKVAQAVTEAPKDAAGVVGELRRGEF